MSAIVGIYRFDGEPIEPLVLRTMVESVAHRGADGAGMWSEGPVGLGHCLLCTTPKSRHEEIPLVSGNGTLVLTADARIDNRDELMIALGLDLDPRNRITDGELILSAYERWGESCPERLLGDFAMAIWDQRCRTLFCARDHLGVRPFYYHKSNFSFVFASEIKALLRVPWVPRRLEETRVADYLMPILEDKAITFYEQIFRLPPGHSITVSAKAVRTRVYWFLDPARELRYRSDEEYAESFRTVFTEAVRCRLRGDSRIGSMLSGGLDSSSIVCIARKLRSLDGNSQLPVFSATFEDVPQSDECGFIDAVVNMGGVEPRKVHADRLSPLEDLDRMFWHEEEPFYAPNLYMHWALYSAAQHEDVHIMLDGIDGDTVLWQSMTYPAELLRAWRWKLLAEEVTGLSSNLRLSALAVSWRYVLKPLVPAPVRRAWHTLKQHVGSCRAASSIISRDFARRIKLAERVEALLRNQRWPSQTLRESHWSRLTSGLVPFVLEVADRAAAAFSIEPRYPFFDRRVVEFCLALPPEQKFNRGYSRMVLRRALAGLLPEKVRWRSGKSNLSPAFVHALAHEQALLDELLINNVKPLEPYINLRALRETYLRYKTHGAEEDAYNVWRAATLALWLRRTPGMSC